MKQFFVATLLFIGGIGNSAADPHWTRADAGYHWSFPSDHWPHRDFQTEWWYFTGHLKSADGTRAFGYQFTFFRIGLLNAKPALDSDWATQGLIMGHAAVLDKKSGAHIFSLVFSRESPLLGEFNTLGQNPLGWSLAPTGTDGKWLLSWNGQAFDFAMTDTAQKTGFVLSTTPLKPLIFEGSNGLSQKNQSGRSASQYYSFTRLATTGTLTINGQTFSVNGESWMDKEFSSNTLDKNQIGWDWFSLQFDDGRELMFYYLRGANGEPDFARGTLVPSGVRAPTDARYLSPESWQLKQTANWKSPATGAVYPSGWTLTLSKEHIDCRITPVSNDQENRGAAPGLPYWEGAVDIVDATGKPVGKGFVELTGRVIDRAK